MPILLYGLEICPLKKSDFRSLDFIICRPILYEIVQNNQRGSTVRLCQKYFNFELPSDIVKRRILKFESTLLCINIS